MIQDIIAQFIVFLAAGISIYSLIKSLSTKKASKCSGCAGCDFKKFQNVKLNVKQTTIL